MLNSTQVCLLQTPKEGWVSAAFLLLRTEDAGTPCGTRGTAISKCSFWICLCKRKVNKKNTLILKHSLLVRSVMCFQPKTRADCDTHVECGILWAGLSLPYTWPLKPFYLVQNKVFFWIKVHHMCILFGKN